MVCMLSVLRKYLRGELSSTYHRYLKVNSSSAELSFCHLYFFRYPQVHLEIIFSGSCESSYADFLLPHPISQQILSNLSNLFIHFILSGTLCSEIQTWLAPCFIMHILNQMSLVPKLFGSSHSSATPPKKKYFNFFPTLIIAKSLITFLSSF